MSSEGRRSLLALEAARRVADVRDDPQGRLALAEESYVSATNLSLHRFSRAELAFIEWEIRRGVLGPVRTSGDGGSAWWRAVNQVLLKDCAEASLLHREGFTTGGTNPAVDLWLRFFRSPSPTSWYRAHNASIVSGYLHSTELAKAESGAEQLLMNIILTRALYGYLLAAQQARLGWLARLGTWLADPSGEGLATMIDLPDFYPATYPMAADDEQVLEGVGYTPQSILGRLANLVIFSNIERLFSWNAERIGIPDLCALTTKDAPCYPSGSPALTTRAAADAKRLRDLDDWFDAIAAAVTPDGILDMLPWVAGVSLRDATFVSWAMEPYMIEPLLPDGLELDTYNGKGYITAVALNAQQMHFRGLPPMHAAASYLELNFRTYVRHQGERGIFFISVDATPGGVFEYLARFMFRIPYHESRMTMPPPPPGSPATFTSRRVDPKRPAAYDLAYTVDTSVPAAPPASGSLEEFICVRDLAFSKLLGIVLQLEVRHPQWTLQPATLTSVDASGLFEGAGIDCPPGTPSIFYSPRSDGVMLLPVPA